MSTMKQASTKNVFNTRRLTPIAAVILALGAGHAYGATISWCAGTSGNWTDVSSSCGTSPGWVGGVPGAADSAVLPTGGGSVTLNAGMGTQTVNDLQILNGKLVGTGTVITNSFTWKGDGREMSGGGTTIVKGTATIWGARTSAPTGKHFLGNATDGTSRTLQLTKTSTTTFKAQELVAASGSTINNDGTFTSIGAYTGTGLFQGNNAISSAGTGTNTFNNSGTYIQAAGPSTFTTTISPAFTNTGIVNVNTGANLALNGGHDYTQNTGSTIVDGTLSVGPGKSVLIAGGTLSGNGTISGNLANIAGMLSPGNSPGKLSVSGDFSQSSTGLLNIEIAGPSPHGGLGGYDWLAISGHATLGGSLNLTFGYTPTVGQSFEVLTYGSHGQSFFDHVMVGGLDRGLTLTRDFGATGLTYTVAAVPEPETYAMILAGLGLMTLVMRRRKQ